MWSRRPVRPALRILQESQHPGIDPIRLNKGQIVARAGDHPGLELGRDSVQAFHSLTGVVDLFVLAHQVQCGHGEASQFLIGQNRWLDRALGGKAACGYGPVIHQRFHRRPAIRIPGHRIVEQPEEKTPGEGLSRQQAEYEAEDKGEPHTQYRPGGSQSHHLLRALRKTQGILAADPGAE